MNNYRGNNMGNGQGTHTFIKSGKRQEKIRLSDWNGNPEKYDKEIQEWQDRRGVKSGYGTVVSRTVYKTCDPCEKCNYNGFIKIEKEII